MATANLADAASTVDTSKDSIIIKENFESIRGGRTLVTTGFPLSVIPAGHVVIRETATGDHKPMPLDEDAYDTLPADHTYVGVVVSSVPTAKPFVGIMVRGTVNPTAAHYAYTTILAAFKTATENRIAFIAD